MGKIYGALVTDRSCKFIRGGDVLREDKLDRRWISLGLLLTLLFGGCAAPTVPPSPAPASPTAERPEPTPTTEAAGVKVAASDIQRETNPEVADGDLEALAAAQNRFALDLYRVLKESDENLFYSPYSIAVALSMAYAGARGETADQMAEVLHLGDLTQEGLHPAMNALQQGLTGQEGITLTVANSLWAQEGYPFQEPFLDTLARHYGAGVRLVDYVEPAAREEAREAVNRWAEEETNGRIEELITENMLNEMTRFILANAIYFNAKWDEPFLNGTSEAPFYLLDGTEVTVPMMSRRAGTPYVAGDGYQAVELPYKGGGTRMVVVLPGDGEFGDFEDELDQALIDEILAGFTTEDVKLYLPRFSYDAELDLVETLKTLGMVEAFNPSADFSGMDGAGELLISAVAHKAFVAVDEEGTEAAAATGVVGEVTSMPVMVRADRPFVFFIYDADLGTVLFMGRVLNPMAE
jgi:serpin B